MWLDSKAVNCPQKWGNFIQRYVDEFCYRYNLRNDNPVLAFGATINLGLGVEQ